MTSPSTHAPTLDTPVHSLLPGQTLHLYLDRASGIHIEQGAVQLVSHEWVAERCVPMTQRLDTGAGFEPGASGWVFLQALPGGSVRLRMVSRPSGLSLYIACVLRFLGAARFLRPVRQ